MQKVIDLFSSVQNGLPKEIGQVERSLGDEVGGKFPIGVVGTDLKRGLRENEIPARESVF